MEGNLVKIIALDIETLNLDMDKDNLSFDDPAGWQTSCVCIHDHHREQTYQYVADPLLIDDIKSDDLIYSWEFLAWDLEEWFYQGYTLVTKNGTSFDLPIISKAIEDGGCGVATPLNYFIDSPKTKITHYGEKDVAPKHLDICLYLRDITEGYRFSLQNLIKGCLGESESKLMAASKAPEEWNKKNYREVLEYCSSDAEYTAQVYFYGRREGRILAVGRNDKGDTEEMKVKVWW
jgi:DNA polymerase elongation subunit (family B)